MGINESLAHLSSSGSSSFNKEKNRTSKSAHPDFATPIREIEPTTIHNTVSVRDNDKSSVQESPLSDWCIHVFGSFLTVYETQWVYQYGNEPNSKFIEFANDLSAEGLNRTLKHCRERIQMGNSWPPQMGELWVIKDTLTAEELLDCRLRVFSRSPNNQIEKWLIQNKLYHLKRAPEFKLDELFKKYYLEAKRLQEKGMLITEPPPNQLAQHSVKNLNDLKREEFEQKNGKQLNPRIAQILAGVK